MSSIDWRIGILLDIVAWLMSTAEWVQSRIDRIQKDLDDRKHQARHA